MECQLTTEWAICEFFKYLFVHSLYFSLQALGQVWGREWAGEYVEKIWIYKLFDFVYFCDCHRQFCSYVFYVRFPT